MQNLTLPLSQLINDLEVHDLEPTLQEYKITPIYVQKSQSTKVVDLIKEYFDNSYNNINNLLESQNLFDRKKHEHCIQQGSDIYLDQQKDILNQSNRDFQISQLKSLETQNISQVYVESPHKQSYSCLSKLQQSPLPVDVFISQKLLNSNSSQKCACSAFEDLQYTKFMDESAPETFDKGVHRYDDVLIKEVKKVQQEDKQIPLYIKNQRRFEQIKQGSLKLSVADQYIKQSKENPQEMIVTQKVESKQESSISMQTASYSELNSIGKLKTVVIENDAVRIESSANWLKSFIFRFKDDDTEPIGFQLIFFCLYWIEDLDYEVPILQIGVF